MSESDTGSGGDKRSVPSPTPFDAEPAAPPASPTPETSEVSQPSQAEQAPAPAAQRGTLATVWAILRGLSPRTVLGILAGIVLVVFIAQNTRETEVNFLGWDWMLPVFLLLLIIVALTVLFTELVRKYLQYRRRDNQAQKQE